MSYIKYIIGAICLTYLVGACSLPKQGGEGGSSFVTVRDGKFYQGEQEYRFVGTNFWYGAILASEGRGGNRDRLLKELDLMQEVGIDNVRVLVGGDGREGIPSHIQPKLQLEPGVYNDTLLQGLDFLMAELEKRNMKAVLFLNNAWEWSGGYGAYLDWVGFSADVQSSKEPGKTVHFDRTPVPSLEGWWEYMQYVSNFVLNDSAKTLANNHLKFIVSRTNTVTGKPYSESKALMAWEIANEPRCFADDSLHKAKFVEWIDQQSTMIKSIDPNHLVTTGSEGYHGCQDDMKLFTAIHTLPNIDYACIHIWPNNWGWLGQFNQNYDADKTIDANAADPIVDRVQAACDSTIAYMKAAHDALAEAVAKDSLRSGVPIVLEEFGYPRDRFLFTPGSPTVGRDAYYKKVFDTVRYSDLVNGCNFWGWGGLANVKHTIWQPYEDYVCDPAQEEQGLNSIFACDTSTMNMIKEVNLTPSCNTLVANDSDWVWYGDEPCVIDLPITILSGQEIKFDSLEIIFESDCKDMRFQRTIAGSGLTLNYTIHIEDFDFFGKKPGFYHLTVKVNGKNIVHNTTEVYGNQLPIDFFNIGYEPEKIVSEPDPQPDFKQFWDEARAELAQTPMKAQVKELKDRKGEKRAYNAILQGLDGAPVQVYYTVPANRGKKYPIHIINMGYSSKPWPLDLTDNGWIDVIVSSRGQGSNEEVNNPYGKWVQYGLDSPKNYYYRGAYLDCVRAIDYLVTLPETDTCNIFLEGGSQGSAYSMACAALDHRVRAVACYITFMSDFPDYFKIAEWPANEIFAKQKELGIADEELYKTLSYFDIKNLAPWIECPVYMAIGLQDVTCPPHTNFAGYNQVKTEKQYHIFRNYGHHVDYSYWTPSMYEFYEGHTSK